MNLAWKLVVFTFIINISAGITVGILGFDTDIPYDAAQVAEYDVYGARDNTTSVFNQAPVQTETNWADNLLGMIGLGFMVDLVNFMTNYLYGIVDIIFAILPDEAKTTGLESLLNALISIMYSLSLFSMFTGKELNNEG